MVVVTKDRMVRNRVVTVDEPVTQDELHSIRNYVNQNFSGWLLSRIHGELKERLAQESAAYDALLKKLTLLYAKGLLDVGLMPEIHMDGASYLLGLDLHLTHERSCGICSAPSKRRSGSCICWTGFWSIRPATCMSRSVSPTRTPACGSCP